jgi:NADPH-dependent ferric siderophore reductase
MNMTMNLTKTSSSAGAGPVAVAAGSTPPAGKHAVERVRHELKRRTLDVVAVTRLAPKMVRVTLGGADLAGFTSLGYDDHVKLIFPSPDTPDQPAMRDYTPRRFDAAKRQLDIDFVLHGEGPASTWAAQAAVGQTLNIGGPRGSFVVPTDFDCYLLVGDESAWPAIGRRLEELPEHAVAFVVAEVDTRADEQAWQSKADVSVTWVHRNGAAPGQPELLARAVRKLQLPPGDCYMWAAGESSVVRDLRPQFVNRGAPKEWIKAAGYWKHGAIATHETIAD